MEEICFWSQLLRHLSRVMVGQLMSYGRPIIPRLLLDIEEMIITLGIFIGIFTIEEKYKICRMFQGIIYVIYYVLKSGVRLI